LHLFKNHQKKKGKAMNTKFKALQIKRQFLISKYVVGIDPAKTRHQAAIVDCHGMLSGKPFSFANSLQGYQNLLKKVKMQTADVNAENIVFAIESACNLWLTLAHYLRKQGYEVLIVNPLSTKQSRPLVGHDFSRTDPKDALLVASNAQRGYFDFYRDYSDEIKAMHSLSITYHKLRKNLVQMRNRIHALMDRCFPEFFNEFSTDSKTGCYLLGKYFRPSHFLLMDIELESEIIRKLSYGNCGRRHLENLQKHAQHSIGIELDEGEELCERLALDSWLSLTVLIEQQMEKVLKQLKELSAKSPNYDILLSLKGISEKQASLFIAETRDLQGFNHYKQLEKFAGYNLRQSQSGDYVGPRHINHIGNRRLSCILYKMCEETIKYIPEVRVKFVGRQLAKRSYRKNVVACASKLLRLIMTLVKEGRRYEARANGSVGHLYNLEKKYELVKNRDRIRFAKKVV
jgi:transposase